jgi:hypothetical protein
MRGIGDWRLGIREEMLENTSILWRYLNMNTHSYVIAVLFIMSVMQRPCNTLFAEDPVNNYEVIKRSTFDNTDYLLVKYPVIDNPNYKDPSNLSKGTMYINNPKQVNPIVIIKVNPDKSISKLYTIYYPFNDNTGGSEIIEDYRVFKGYLYVVKSSYFGTWYTILNLDSIDKPIAENIEISRNNPINNMKLPSGHHMLYDSVKEFTDEIIVIKLKYLQHGHVTDILEKTIEYKMIEKEARAKTKSQ